MGSLDLWHKERRKEDDGKERIVVNLQWATKENGRGAGDASCPSYGARWEGAHAHICINQPWLGEQGSVNIQGVFFQLLPPRKVPSMELVPPNSKKWLSMYVFSSVRSSSVYPGLLHTYVHIHICTQPLFRFVRFGAMLPIYNIHSNHFSAFLCISLHFTAFLCIPLHFSAFLWISLHSSAFLYISLHFSAFFCISLNLSAFLYTFLHFSAFYILHFKTIWRSLPSSYGSHFFLY